MPLVHAESQNLQRKSWKLSQKMRNQKEKKPEKSLRPKKVHYAGQLSQVEKEPELTPKSKSSIKKKAANTKAKDTQDAQLISAANTERVQNLLQRREQARTSEVIEITELEESDSTSKHSRKPHDQPTGPNLAPSLLNQLSTEKQSNVKSPALLHSSCQTSALDFSYPLLTNQLHLSPLPQGFSSPHHQWGQLIHLAISPFPVLDSS